MLMFKEKERRIVKVNFCLQKQDREQYHDRKRRERKKEKKRKNATHRELLGRCRECRCSSQKTYRDDVCYKRPLFFKAIICPDWILPSFSK